MVDVENCRFTPSADDKDRDVVAHVPGEAVIHLGGHCHVCVLMACIVMAYIVMAYIVMAYIVMAYIVMAYIVMAYIVMAHTVMAYIVMGRRSHLSGHCHVCVDTFTKACMGDVCRSG